MITLNALVPADDPRDDFPIAVRQDIEVKDWDEWRQVIDFHGIMSWTIISEHYPPMPHDMLYNREEIAGIDRVYYKLFNTHVI